MSATEDEASKAASAAAAAPPAAAAAPPCKIEDTTPTVAMATEPPAAPVLPSEALATAAAAAATVEVTPDAVPGATTSRVSLLNEVDGQGKRRFFPRVKHLIGNKEWEDFLTQVLQCIEEAGASEASAASHKANNAWYKAFDLIYGGVAREYSIPTGKNRYHKFKDKILEVWVALEAQAPGENHCRDLALEQYERYKRALTEANKSGSGGGHHHHPSIAASNKASKIATGSSAGSAGGKIAGGKRSYSTAMGGGASLSFASTGGSGGSAGLWKNLDESSVLKGLPEDLRSLVHLKQLSKEMAASTANRAARRGIEEHSKKLDGAYLEALAGFLRVDTEGAAVKKEEASGDVEMADGGDEAAAASENKETTTTPPSATAAASSAYDRCLAVAFLYRYASTLHEQKMLADAYIKCTSKCVTFASEQQPPPSLPSPQAAAAATTVPPAAATASEAAPAAQDGAKPDEGHAPADTAAAMEETSAFPPVEEVQI